VTILAGARFETNLPAGDCADSVYIYVEFPMPTAVNSVTVRLIDYAGPMTGRAVSKCIPGMIASQTYEADGPTAKITYANGVSTEFFYSAERRWPIRITTKNAAGAELMNNAYSRDGEAGQQSIQ
jgi:hypothetical protein